MPIALPSATFYDQAVGKQAREHLVGCEHGADLLLDPVHLL
jgi:hypothetical protein